MIERKKYYNIQLFSFIIRFIIIINIISCYILESLKFFVYQLLVQAFVFLTFFGILSRIECLYDKRNLFKYVSGIRLVLLVGVCDISLVLTDLFGIRNYFGVTRVTVAVLIIHFIVFNFITAIAAPKYANYRVTKCYDQEINNPLRNKYQLQNLLQSSFVIIWGCEAIHSFVLLFVTGIESLILDDLTYIGFYGVRDAFLLLVYYFWLILFAFDKTPIYLYSLSGIRWKIARMIIYSFTVNLVAIIIPSKAMFITFNMTQTIFSVIELMLLILVYVFMSKSIIENSRYISHK